MSLTVHVFTLRDGEMLFLDAPKDWMNLAGFESWRTEVWGSAAVRELGARFFPVLAEDNLWVEPDEVLEFAGECARLGHNLSAIAPFPYPPWPDATHLTVIDAVAANLVTIQLAAGRALGVGGGVVIW
ncbi:hypothetical protein NDR87_33650 [Nocardia sp. CDC159]|uniref:Uncharacterized protein n=1 Tax=Nocardia pulmonis TaxID=2951408 RepID=A0A9X2ECW9_9NOCA|nr:MULTISPECIES: hypothetical protein [Nocardia]MCM6778442.1 hypothetical protein [Nocardia pulmonis]MCM6791331.1 hypothetical protein [Nocardia sp. CDC159]